MNKIAILLCYHLLHVASMEVIPYFDLVPICVLVSGILPYLDPATLVRLGRVNRFLNGLSITEIDRSYKSGPIHELVWDIEKVYDVHQAILGDDCITEPLEQLIRMNIPKKERDLRLESLIHRYYLPNLFGRQVTYSVGHLSPKAAELVRMILKHKRFDEAHISLLFPVVHDRIIREALPYLKQLSPNDMIELHFARPGLLKHLYPLIPDSHHSKLLTYLHENECWKVDEIQELLPIDYAAALYCFNMATDGNSEAVKFLISRAFAHVNAFLIYSIILRYNRTALISLIPHINIGNEFKKAWYICHFAQHNLPIETYKAVRGVQRVNYYHNALECLIADPSYKVPKKLRPNMLLEVALMYGCEESICTTIAQLPKFRRQIHFILLALIKKYSNGFMKRLIESKGSRFTRVIHFLNVEPDNFGDERMFEAEMHPETLFQLIRHGCPYGAAAAFYLSFYPKNSPVLIQAVQAILNDLAGSKDRDRLLTTLRAIWIWKHKDALQVNSMLAEFSFVHGIDYTIPSLKDEDIDIVYSFTDEYSLYELVDKIHLRKVSLCADPSVHISHTQIMLARRIFLRTGGYQMLKSKIKSLDSFYALAIFLNVPFDFDQMLLEIRLQKSVKFWSNFLTNMFNHDPFRIIPLIDYLIKVCDDEFAVCLVLGMLLLNVMRKYDEPNKIQFIHRLTADKWNRIISAYPKLLESLNSGPSKEIFKLFQDLGLVDFLFVQIARKDHLYAVADVLISFPVFSSLNDEEKGQADLILRQAHPPEEDATFIDLDF